MIALKADTPVTALKNIKLEDIKPGAFVGTAAMAGTDGKLTATEVLVFPESARGTEKAITRGTWARRAR